MVSTSAAGAFSSICRLSLASGTGAAEVVGVPPRATILSARKAACESSSGISVSKKARRSWRIGPLARLAYVRYMMTAWYSADRSSFSPSISVWSASDIWSPCRSSTGGVEVDFRSGGGGAVRRLHDPHERGVLGGRVDRLSATHRLHEMGELLPIGGGEGVLSPGR